MKQKLLKAKFMKPKEGTITPPAMGVPAKLESTPASFTQDNKIAE
jgi:hypothetical protein